MGARVGKRVAVLSLHFLAAGAIATASEFKPGWIYVSATSNKGFVSGDLIWAFNPANGQSELLGDVGQAGTSDLLFTPDGSRLLDAMFSLDAIGAVRPDGGYDPYLDSDDGISNPWAMTYDRPGNLFVIGTSGQVLRFPAGGGPGEVFADQADGIGGRGPLATSPQGDLYYAGFESTKIIKVTPDGVGSVFATLDQGIVSMCTDTAGNLFVQGVDDLFKIDLGDPNSLHVLNDLGGGQFTNIRMSPDESALYRVSANSVRTIDPVTGEWLQLGLIPVTPDHYHGTGMAVYVPEPATTFLLLPLVLVRVRRRARWFRSTSYREVCHVEAPYVVALDTGGGVHSAGACARPERRWAMVQPGADEADRICVWNARHSQHSPAHGQGAVCGPQQ